MLTALYAPGAAVFGHPAGAEPATTAAVPSVFAEAAAATATSKRTATTSFSSSGLLGRTLKGAQCRCGPGTVKEPGDRNGRTTAEVAGDAFQEQNREATDLGTKKFELWRDSVNQYDQNYIRLQRTLARFTAARDLLQLSKKNAQRVHEEFCAPAVERYGGGEKDNKDFTCMQDWDIVKSKFSDALQKAKAECQFGCVQPLKDPGGGGGSFL